MSVPVEAEPLCGVGVFVEMIRCEAEDGGLPNPVVAAICAGAESVGVERVCDSLIQWNEDNGV